MAKANSTSARTVATDGALNVIAARRLHFRRLCRA